MKHFSPMQKPWIRTVMFTNTSKSIKDHGPNLIDSAGTFTISNGQVVKQLGIVSSSDVLEAEEYKEVDGEYLEKLWR